MSIAFFRRAAGRIKRILKGKWGKLRSACFPLCLRVKYRPKIMNSIQTVRYLETHACSMARFGDGEYGQMFYGCGTGFQAADPALAEALKAVMASRDRNLLICIPHTLISTRGYREPAASFWRCWTAAHGELFLRRAIELAGPDCRFGDTQATRPYMDWKTSQTAETIFPIFKKLWEGKDLLVVEGTHTRLGVGNDLLSNVRSVKRILCPAEGAFSVRQEILSAVLAVHTGELVLLALGMTATVLAADLSSAGIWALDVGHLDIEYEWFLRGASEKCAVPGKYVNEVAEGRDAESACADEAYQRQIIMQIISK